MKRISFFIAISILLAFAGCTGDKQPFLPKVTGKPGEVLL